MANRKVRGKDILLFIDPDGGTTYDTVVCLTSNSMNRTTATVDAASKCGPDSAPGEQSVSVEFQGQQVVENDTGKLSGANLHDLWQSAAQIGWKMGPASPITGDVIYEGKGFISDLGDTYDMGSATFSGTLAVSGFPTKTITGGS